MGEVGLEGLVHHVFDDGTWGVEGTSLLAGSSLGFFITGGEEVFEDLAEKFEVEGDFLIDGGVLDYGELVAVQDGDNAGDLHGLALLVTVCGGEVGCFPAVKKRLSGT